MDNNKRWNWLAIVGLFGGLQVLLFGLGLLVKFVRGETRPSFGEAVAGSAENDLFYNQFRQPVFAPPDWVFAPVWTLNNSLWAWGIARVLNMPPGTPGRERYLALQAAFALQFVNFNGVYFGLRSPIGGALLTVGGLLPVAEGMRIAITEMKHWRVALSLSTLLPWLVLASFTSVLVALWNRDDFFRTGTPIEPPPGWVKRPADAQPDAE